MKTTSSLARNLRALLGVIRIVTLVGLIVTPILLTPLPIMDTKGAVRFETSPKHLTVSSDLGQSGTRVQLKSLTADVDIFPSAPMPPDLLALRRQTIVPAMMASLLMWFLVAHFLWRLFSRLEKGEIFTDENLKLVRRIGAAIVVCSFVEALAGIWSDWRFSEFVRHHFTIGGLTVQHATGSHFEPRFMLAGLIVLVIAEVFRQGLALQHDAELTV